MCLYRRYAEGRHFCISSAIMLARQLYFIRPPSNSVSVLRRLTSFLCWLNVRTRIIPAPAGLMLCAAIAVSRDGWTLQKHPGRKGKPVAILSACSPPPCSPAHALMSRLLPRAGHGLWAQPFQVKESFHWGLPQRWNVGLSIQWVYKHLLSLVSPCLYFTGSGCRGGQCFGTLLLLAGSWTTCISWRIFSAIQSWFCADLGWDIQLQRVLWGRNAIKSWKPKITFSPSLFSPPALQAHTHSGHGREGRGMQRLSERAMSVKLWGSGLQCLVWLPSSEGFHQ